MPARRTTERERTEQRLRETIERSAQDIREGKTPARSTASAAGRSRGRRATKPAPTPKRRGSPPTMPSAGGTAKRTAHVRRRR
jgi:hypothetical protein